MSEYPKTGGKILVADDDRFVIKLVELILTKEGFDVETVESGEQALAVAGGLAPSLIILDIEMPGLDGYATCRALAEDPKTRGIPVIFLSSRREVDAKIAGLELGAADYVAKPFDPREFLARVRASLRTTRSVSKRAAAAGLDDHLKRQAHALREGLLPTALPELPGLELGSSFEPGEDSQGEWFDAIERGGRLLLALGGVGASGLAASAQALLQHQWLRRCAVDVEAPGSLLKQLDALLVNAGRQQVPAGLQLVGWAPGENSLRAANAGRGAAVLCRPDCQPELLSIDGPLLAGGESMAPGFKLPFGPGSVLALASEGLLQLPDEFGEPIGGAGLERAVAEAPDGLTAAGLAAALRQSLGGELTAKRDSTLLVLRRVDG